jgi:SP family general alpha glucoside:H+ symporter-like MFS transporter
MSSGMIEPKDESPKGVVVNSEVLVDGDLMGDAVNGENREHEMGVWEATKTHPWACFWAFVMCFTIVSLLPKFSDLEFLNKKPPICVG